MILNQWHTGPGRVCLEMYEGILFMVIVSDRSSTIYTNWVGVQEYNDLLEIYLPIIHEKKNTMPSGERVSRNRLSFKFMLSLVSRNFPQTLLSELITSPLCPQTSLYLSQSTWVTRYQSLLLTCMSLYTYTQTTQVVLKKRNPIFFIFIFPVWCLTHNTQQCSWTAYLGRTERAGFEIGTCWNSIRKAHGWRGTKNMWKNSVKNEL